MDGSFPNPEIVEEAGMELAQKLGLPLEVALDKIVSAVLQQRAGGLSFTFRQCCKCHADSWRMLSHFQNSLCLFQ